MNTSERNIHGTRCKPRDVLWKRARCKPKGLCAMEGSLQVQGIVCNGGLVASPRDCVGLCAVEGSLQAQGLLFALDGCCFIKLSN